MPGLEHLHLRHDPLTKERAGRQERDGTSEDRTGAHVIVIDLA